MLGYWEIEDAYPEPVGGSGEGHARGTVASRVELSNDSPDKGTPGSGEGNDEQAGEDDQDVSSGVSRGLVQGERADQRVDQEADDGPESTDDERHAAAGLLDDVETTESAANVDGAENDLGDVGVLETDTLEDGGSVVKEEVGTGELLAGLENDTDHDAAKHGRRSEHLIPLGVDTSALLVELEADLGNLVIDGLVVDVDTTKAGNGGAGLLLAALTESETRRLGEEEHTTTEDGRPEETKTDSDSPGGAALHLVGTVVDHVGSPDTEGNEELVASNDDTADDGGGALRLVHGDSDTERTDTDTSDETADSELSPVRGGRDLDDHTDHHAERRDRDGELASKGVRDLRDGERTDERSSAEHRNDSTLASGIERVALSVPFTESAGVVLHVEVSRDLTGGVAEP